MAFSTLYNARVQSILDFNYELTIDSSFYPLFKNAARKRLQNTFPNAARAIQQAFRNRAVTRVWGIVIENEGQPLYVVQNLACKVTNQSYRRVLRINMNDHYPSTHT
jgi:NAD-dependent oxidoreductase involved in siderophore biosynthesis